MFLEHALHSKIYGTIINAKMFPTGAVKGIGLANLSLFKY